MSKLSKAELAECERLDAEYAEHEAELENLITKVTEMLATLMQEQYICPEVLAKLLNHWNYPDPLSVDCRRNIADDLERLRFLDKEVYGVEWQEVNHG